MCAELEHPIGPNTLEDWLAAPDSEDGTRLQLIWGYFFTNPAPSGQRQYAAVELRQLLQTTFRDAGRADLYAVPAVGVEISRAARMALIPDVMVLDTEPIGVSFKAENLLLAAEVWSPGNTRGERDSKMAAYATAGVPFFWAVNLDKVGGVSVTAYRLDKGRYIEDLTAEAGAEVTIKAAPEPVTFDPADLNP